MKFQRWIKWRATSRAALPWTTEAMSCHGIRGVEYLSMKSAQVHQAGIITNRDRSHLTPTMTYKRKCGNVHSVYTSWLGWNDTFTAKGNTDLTWGTQSSTCLPHICFHFPECEIITRPGETWAGANYLRLCTWYYFSFSSCWNNIRLCMQCHLYLLLDI